MNSTLDLIEERILAATREANRRWSRLETTDREPGVVYHDYDGIGANVYRIRIGKAFTPVLSIRARMVDTSHIYLSVLGEPGDREAARLGIGSLASPILVKDLEAPMVYIETLISQRLMPDEPPAPPADHETVWREPLPGMIEEGDWRHVCSVCFQIACEQDFMAGQLCVLPQGHAGPHKGSEV
jgi:hypothetical protein